MTLNTTITRVLGITYPIIQAGMAGGVTSSKLVAAVSNAGGLGTLGAGYMSPESIREQIREVRSMTKHPFAVNLFIPEASSVVPSEQIHYSNQLLKPYREKLGIEESILTSYSESFEDQVRVILEEKVPVFSFTFGIPSSEIIKECKKNNIHTIGTATTVDEGVLLETNGVDIVVGQGSEAGGHRGTFLQSFEDSTVGTVALIPQLVDQLQIPVISSGGIMDGRGIAASLALGAAGVQLGTAFICCIESGAHNLHKQAILHSTEQSTEITRTFSGKPARGIKNQFMIDMKQHQDYIPDYPVQNALTRDIRSAAAKQNIPGYMSLWAGQGGRLSREIPVKDLMNILIQDTKNQILSLQRFMM